MKTLTVEIKSLKDFDLCTAYAFALFCSIAQQHGEEKTRNMFRVMGPLRGQDFKLAKKWELAFEYYKMPRRNIRKLAAELAEQNNGRPKSERHGPGGTTDVEAMRKHINRMRKDGEFRRMVGSYGLLHGLLLKDRDKKSLGPSIFRAP